MFTSYWFYKSIGLGILIWLAVSLGAIQTLAAPPADIPTHPGYVRAGLLNVRSGPGLNYGVVATARYGEQVILLGRTASADWLKIGLSAGQQGWAVVRYIEASRDALNSLPVLGQQPPPSGGPTATVSVWQLNVRGGPGLQYNIIGTLWRGNTQSIVGRSADSNWLQIRVSSPYPTFAEPTGWVMARYVWSNVPIHTLPITDGGSPPPVNEKIGVVTVYRLNMRSGPGLTYPVVGHVSNGQQVQLLGRTAASDWLKVDLLGGYGGWVMAQYIHSFVPVSSLPILDNQPAASRIKFAPGNISATVPGNLAANGMNTYVLTAQAGQTMTVQVDAGGGNILLSIYGADGQVLKSSGAGSASWSGQLPVTQDYFMTISTGGGNAASYILYVTIPPR